MVSARFQSDGAEDATAAALAQIDSMQDDILETLSTLVRIPSITPKYPGLDYDETVGGESRCNQGLRPTLGAAG